MKKLFVFPLFLLVATISFAQNPAGNSPMSNLKIGRIYGKLREAGTRQAVAYASITVEKSVNGRDSLIGGALSEDNGDFNITGLPMGMFKVKVSFVGYKTFEKLVKVLPPDNVEQDLGDLQLSADSKVLGELQVTAEKTSTQLSLEKRVFNVDKNITSIGGTAEDVLKNVPSVTVDADGNAKLREKGATIYVDGKPTLMTLTQIPSDQIESVEVISNPSAKYDASITGGIVNLVLKKNRKPGYNGIAVLGAGQNDRYNGMLNLNAHEGRLNMTAFYNINSAKSPSAGYTHKITKNTEGVTTSFFDQNSTAVLNNVFQVGKLGLDYSVNNRNTLSLAGTVVRGRFDISTYQDYTFKSPSGVLDSFGVRSTEPRNNFKNNSIETNWKKTFAKKGELLTASATYGFGSVSNVGDWTTTNIDAATGKPKANTPELVRIAGANKSSQFLFQLDYVNPINDSTKIEMGVRSLSNGRDQNYFYNDFKYDKNAYAQNIGLSQDADITDAVNAAYLTYSSRFKNQINYQIGLRFEQSSLVGVSRLADNPNFGFHYPSKTQPVWKSFFPSFFLSKKLDEKTELGFNISRKIERPNFRQLMPGVQGADKQNVQIGNPALQPEFLDAAELTYNKMFGNHNWLITLYGEYEENTIKPFARPSATDPSVLITTFVNGKNETAYGVDNTLKLALSKNIELTTSFKVFHVAVSIDTFSYSDWVASGKANLQWKLPYSFALQASGSYDGNKILGQGYRKGFPSADFAVKKSFFHNAANVSFSINDVFNTRRDLIIYDQPRYYQETMRRRETRFYKISLQIPFGKPDASIFKKRKQQEGQQDMDFGG